MMETKTKLEKFQAYGTLQLDVSTDVNAENDKVANEKALSNLEGIGAVILTIVKHDGTVTTLNVHNWELLNGVEAIFGEGE